MNKEQIISFNKDMLRLKEGDYYYLCPDPHGFIKESCSQILGIPLLIPYCLGENSSLLSFYGISKEFQYVEVVDNLPSAPDYYWKFDFQGYLVRLAFVNFGGGFSPEVHLSVRNKGRYLSGVCFSLEAHRTESDIKNIFSNEIPGLILETVFTTPF